jgi:CDP-diacylglycerol--serine O-phosphatidyltransferase
LISSKQGTWTACALTVGNLLCGFAAVTLAVQGFAAEPAYFRVVPVQVVHAAWLLFLGMILDALDGRVARLTRADTAFGAQLDSLADMVTFGLAPAALAWVAGVSAGLDQNLLWAAGAVYAACAAIRLARYNVKQALPKRAKSSDFEGLPSPAAAGLVAGLLILGGVNDLDLQIRERMLSLLPLVALGAGLLMTSTIPYLHPANRLGRRRLGPLMSLMALLLAGVLALYPAMTLAAAFLGYAMAGLGRWILSRLLPREAEADEPDLAEERLFPR